MMMKIKVNDIAFPLRRMLLLGVSWSLAALTQAQGDANAALRSPQAGVLCDRYFCADAKGVSRSLTVRYLGLRAAQRVFSPGAFDHTAFTFANGIFCDTRARLCWEDRYYGSDGKHSAAISARYTALLFPPTPSRAKVATGEVSPEKSGH
ncbi:hypothetical protein I6G97_12625 [Edwardsiella hoshinae]|nr:YcgJ family protein [Edwardsiella hoshinae]QPR27274.1 hypothetical protein I6G97_12625 [Edwardsiella hoshinae]